MAEPFLGEIRMVGFNFAPAGWAFCNGNLLPISQNSALFDLIGTTYGGDGTTTFGLPDLRGRLPIHQGPGFVIGQLAGEESHTLLVNEIPSHNHSLSGTSAVATLSTPTNNVWAVDRIGKPYNGVSSGSPMSAGTIATAGGGQPHENRPPFLSINLVIALQGIFPTQS